MGELTTLVQQVQNRLMGADIDLRVVDNASFLG